MKSNYDGKEISARRKALREGYTHRCVELRDSGLTNAEIAKKLHLSEALVRLFLLREMKAKAV